ncbi:hypothetical protein AASFL403_17665 [Paenibacillus nuruki]|nr:hypothetical protein AASFL403_17665 [Paenibacillus nuruki]
MKNKIITWSFQLFLVSFFLLDPISKIVPLIHGQGD